MLAYILLISTTSIDISQKEHKVYTYNGYKKYEDMTAEEQSAEFCTALFYCITKYLDNPKRKTKVNCKYSSTRDLINNLCSYIVKPAVLYTANMVNDQKNYRIVEVTIRDIIFSSLKNISNEINNDEKWVAIFVGIKKTSRITEFPFSAKLLRTFCTLFDKTTPALVDKKKIIYEMYCNVTNQLLSNGLAGTINEYVTERLDQNEYFAFCKDLLNTSNNIDHWVINININRYCIEMFSQIKIHLNFIYNAERNNTENVQGTTNSQKGKSAKQKLNNGLKNISTSKKNNFIRDRIINCHKAFQKISFKYLDRICFSKTIYYNIAEFLSIKNKINNGRLVLSEEQIFLNEFLIHSFYFHVDHFIEEEEFWTNDDSVALLYYIIFEVYCMFLLKSRNQNQIKFIGIGLGKINTSLIYVLQSNKTFSF